MSNVAELLENKDTQKLQQFKSTIDKILSLDRLLQYETEIKKLQGELFSIQQFECNNDALEDALIDDYMALQLSGDENLSYSK